MSALNAWLLVQRGRRVRELALIAAPAALVPAAVYGAFLTAVPAHRLFLENLYPVDVLNAAGNAVLRLHAPLTASSFVTLGGKCLLYGGGIAAIRRGDLGTLLSGSGAWISSNGPINGHDGWLARRARSGDWMVEQAVHVWDVFHWVAGGLPVRAYGSGRRDVFTREQPGRDMTDDYQASLSWADGFAVNFVQSWAAPADDGFRGGAVA